MSEAEEKDFLAVGKFRRTHGIRGDLLFTVITDFPERLKPGTTVFVGDQKKPLKISSLKPHNDGIIFGFKGITNPEEAIAYVTEYVYVPLEDRPALPEGEYYHHQIVGLKVVDVNGKDLGIVSEILITGANDVYVTKTDQGKEILIPAVKQVLKEINLEEKTMIVELPEGLIE
jgi:16S rRNA processing protein RimM